MDEVIWLNGQACAVSVTEFVPYHHGRTRERSSPPLRLCANCDGTWQAHRNGPLPYCSRLCRSQASLVRRGRRLIEQFGGPYLAPLDVRQAFGRQVSFALSGGYDSSARALTRQTRRAVWARDEDRCVLCDAPGAEVDHIDGSSGDMSNLRLLCLPCHRQVTDVHLRPITDPAMEAVRQALIARMEAVEPIRECDRLDWKARSALWCAGPGLSSRGTASTADPTPKSQRNRRRGRRGVAAGLVKAVEAGEADGELVGAAFAIASSPV